MRLRAPPAERRMNGDGVAVCREVRKRPCGKSQALDADSGAVKFLAGAVPGLAAAEHSAEGAAVNRSEFGPFIAMSES
jgi:hypothetical protein